MKINTIILLTYLLLSFTMKGQKIVNNEHEFVALFPVITSSNLQIYPVCKSKKNGNKFSGKVISKHFYKYLDERYKKQINPYAKFYACSKFDLDQNHLGLIARSPSQYDNSSIELFAWNKKTQKIDYTIELADNFGDGTWYFSKNAWLIDYQNDKIFDIVIRRKDWEEDENGKEHTKDSVSVWINDGAKMKICKSCNVQKSKYKLFDF